MSDTADLVHDLRAGAYDPMWNAHCEMPKRTAKRAAETIEALQAERDALKANLEASMAYLPQLKQVFAERDALKADAERYRWLRQYGNGIYPDVFNDEGAPILAVRAAAVRLDSAIDAAMRDQTP